MPVDKTNNQLFVFLFVILLSFLTLSGQTANTRLFNNIKVKDGLPVDQIFTITQDTSGFMWFGTINGFLRYDGYTMKVFRLGETAGIALPDNQITAIENDGGSGLWISCYEGLIYFDTHTWESKQIDLGGTREVRCLLNQGDSVLWIGTADGLFRMNSFTSEFVVFNQQNSKLGSNIVRSLYTDSDGNVWVGTFDGLNAISTNGQWLYFNLKGNYKPELKNNLVLDIQPFSPQNDSLLWIGTETGLVLFNRDTFSSEVFNSLNTGFGNEVVKCIFPLNDGNTYFGTDFGFYFFNSKTKESEVSTHDPFNNYSLANNVVWDIFQDNAGIIWLATANGISQLNIDQGMFRFTPVYNVENNIIVGNQVNDLCADETGVLWLATKKGVVAIFPDGKQEVFTADNPPDKRIVLDNINTITADNLGRIWIGSAGGINVWDTKKRKMHTITADFNLNKGLRSNYISAFITPPDGSFWVSTWGGGMYKARGNFMNVDDIFFEYVANFNTNVFSSDDEKIWLKNDKKIYTVDLSTMQTEHPQKLNEAIGQNEISSLLMTSKGKLWVGLNNQLFQFNPHTCNFTFTDVITGRESSINNLVEDFQGDIWGTTLTSVFRYSQKSGEIESFPMKKGIPLDIFLTQSHARSKEGLIFFGGNDGFISFNPAEINKNPFFPKTVISGLRVNNSEIYSLKQLKGRNSSKNLVTFCDKAILRYDQHSISISFSSLHFGDPERNIYAYKLEGYDKEWNYTTGKQNTASYSYLSPAKYHFTVRGTNNDGVWSGKDASLYIEIKPPLWASAWAIVIYIIILQLILISLVITYRNKIRWKEKIKLITLEKEKNEELAKAKQQFFTNISHEFRTPLNLITGPVQSLIEKHKTNTQEFSLLQLISKNSRRLLSLVNQLMDLQKIESRSLELKLQSVELVTLCREQYALFSDLAHSRMISFNIETPAEALGIETDREKLESIIQNLLSNAFKYTQPEGTISLKLEVPEPGLFRISVSDSGKGIAEKDKEHIFKRFYQGKNTTGTTSGYGIGLNLVKEYCELMNGKICFESRLGQGSKFQVEIPFQKGTSNEARQELIETEAYSHNNIRPVNQEPSSAGKPLVLLVDDNPDTLEYIKICLGGKYSFITAADGRRGLELLGKHKPHLIISDIMMPETDGLSFCEQVKRDPRFSNTPVIMLTAMALASQQVLGLKAGADAYLTKPFNIDVLDARIESLLARNQKVDDYIKRSLIIENQEVTIKSADEKLLQEAVQFINNHISDPEINIDKMCRDIGISHSSLYRKVKLQTGMTLNELVRHVKMNKAAQLIKTKKYTIAEIMDETGFSNHSYFAKCFKKEFKVSPREYK